MGQAGRTGWARRLLALAVGMVFAASLAQAQMAASARLSGPIALTGHARALTLVVPLTQPLPYRLQLLADPPRALIDFRTLDHTGTDPATFDLPAGVVGLRLGDAGAGWTRLVVELAQPMDFVTAAMERAEGGGPASLRVRLEGVSAAAFAARVAADAARFAPSGEDVLLPIPRVPMGARPVVVVLDPGHGGVDSGAERDGLREADLMLAFARELAEVLRRAPPDENGGFRVVLTREADVFVSLERRIAIARQAGADLFISLHADAISEGQARGATVYTLALEASDAAAAALAERHDRQDLLGGGVDLRALDDGVAGVLMDIARTETRPATEALAQALVQSITGAGLSMHPRPWQEAAFSVLKAPDIPSVLLEVGFMSSPRDLANLRDAAWRGRMTTAIAQALSDWVRERIETAPMRRQ
jgi:N-acetylmuramoyl-L-alanine amidase